MEHFSRSMFLALLCLVASLQCVAQGSAEYWVSTGHDAFRNGVGAPSQRSANSIILGNGLVFVFYGRTDTGTQLTSGGAYNLLAGNWEFLPNLQGGIGAPPGRSEAMTVWTGSKILLFGGWSVPSSGIHVIRNDGAIYDPAIDVWSVPTNLGAATGAPMARYAGFATWSEGHLWVWGGRDRAPNGYLLPVSNGGTYSLALDQWVNVPALASPISAPTFNEGVVWTGQDMIARGGFGPTTPTWSGASGFICSAGGVFNPSSMSWLNKPILRSGAYAPDRWAREVVWTGEYTLEYGGRSERTTLPQVLFHADGQCYDPDADFFLLRSNLNAGSGAPSARENPRAKWTGAHMLVWSGISPPLNGNSVPYPLDGGLYDPIRDQWISAPNLQGALGSPVGLGETVWTGSEFIVWGGVNHWGTGSQLVNTGGIYVPPRVAPTIRTGHSTAALLANTFFRHRVTVYGCPRASVGVLGMPSWMTQKWLDTGCFLEGTPNATEALQTSIITITADNGIGLPDRQVIRVGPPAPAIIDPIPSFLAQVDRRFEYRIPVSGVSATSLVATGMLSWMSLIGGRVEGYPTPADFGTSSTITVSANSGVGPVASRTFSVTVVAAAPAPVAPTLSGAIPFSATPGVPLFISPQMSGTPSPVASSWNAPNWLTFTGNSIYGTPPVSASGSTIEFDVVAANGVAPAAFGRYFVHVGYTAFDITRDAAIDVVDVQRVVNLILALGTPMYVGEGDVNADSAVDVVDVQAVVNKILNP